VNVLQSFTGALQYGSSHHQGPHSPGTETVLLHISDVSLFTLHTTEYDFELEELFAGYVHVHFNESIFDHVNIVPFPQSSSIESAFSPAGDVLHTTSVLHHAFVNDVVVISGFVHINLSVNVCIASSHSIFSSFR
jgi:hypothetical protein